MAAKKRRRNPTEVIGSRKGYGPPGYYWSGKVHAHHGVVPAGLFKKKARQIAFGLAHASKDERQAMERLNFYTNRAGRNLGKNQKTQLRIAKLLLQKSVPRSAYHLRAKRKTKTRGSR